MKSLWMILLIIVCANTVRMDAQSEAGSCGRSIAPSGMVSDSDTLRFHHRACFAEVDSLAKCTDFVFVKTNPVGWGMLIGNVGVEYQFHERLSAELWIYYSALNYFHRTTKFRTFTVMPTFKWWFAGHNVQWWADAHLGLGFFNYAKGGEWRYQDRNGNTPALGGGLGIGVRIPLSRNQRWWLEPSVGAGVYHLNYDKFENSRNGKLVDTRHRTFFGLDRVSIAVSYRFKVRRDIK